MSRAILRFASYNIHRCFGIDGHYSLSRVARVIAELNADVVGLQEVDIGHGSRAGEWQSDVIARELGFRCADGPTFPAGQGHYGNAVLSRFSIVGSRQIDLSVPGKEPRGALDVDIDWHGTPLRFIVTHFGLGFQERMIQVKRLLPQIHPRAGDPVSVLAGDLNEWVPGNMVVSRIDRAFGRAKHRRTFPSRMPFLPLDRIWVYPHGTLMKTRVHQSVWARVASDHLPVVAEVEV